MFEEIYIRFLKCGPNSEMHTYHKNKIAIDNHYLKEIEKREKYGNKYGNEIDAGWMVLPLHNGWVK